MNRLFEKFRHDLLGLAYGASSLFLALSLVSFNPLDPSLNSLGRSLRATNFCGYVGSFLADGLLQVLGLSAWLLVLGCARLSFKAFQAEPMRWKSLRLVWAALAVFTTSSLLGLYFPQTRIYQNQIAVSGLVGLGLSSALATIFNRIGAQIVLWTAFAVLTVFFSERRLAELINWPLPLMATLRKGFVGFWKKHKAEKLQKISVAKAQTKTKANTQAESPKATETEPQLSLPRFLKGAESILDPQQPEASLAALTLETSPGAPVETKPERRKIVIPSRVPRQVENWDLPKLNLLPDPPASRIRYDEREIKRKAEILKEKLAKFDVNGEVVNAVPGPAVTMFEFRPVADVKLTAVTALARDLKMALSSESLRILAPIPGRDVVGIETSNAHREIVYFKDMLGVEDFWREDMKLPVALGKTSTGEPKVVDLRRMPHLMVAGTTGSGKSVFTVSLISGLLFKHSPKTLKLMIVDPKQVDYAAFDSIPHLAMPVITDVRQAVLALKWAVNEMEKRYRSMSHFGARGLEGYNETVAKLTAEQSAEHDKANQEFDATPGKKNEKYYWQELPYMVIILEEFADLMAQDKSNVEHSVIRLAQKARASGIHLLLATQSPRKEAVTGLIKTNIPGRIAFKVSSSLESRVILDESGAEELLEKGDMLFKSPGGSNLIRHHGPFLADAEVAAIANFWSAQGGPSFDMQLMKVLDGDLDSPEATDEAFGDAEEQDPLYDQIISWVQTQKTVSTSSIQRRFQIGYPRSARIVETFERNGVVGEAHGSKARQVLISNLAQLED